MSDESLLNKIENLTVDEYKTALNILRKQISESDFLMLKVNYEAPNHEITATQLANLVGFKNFEAANLRYGTLAKKFLGHLNIHFKKYAKLNALVEFKFNKKRNEWHWKMRPQVVIALDELGWFRKNELLKNTYETENYVQYHNSDARGKLNKNRSNYFGISTKKRISSLVGSRIWLISGRGNPKKYYLEFWFIVDDVKSLAEDTEFKFFVTGKQGKSFKSAILLNKFSWFKDFLKSQQNFSMGLRKIEKKYVEKLKNLAFDRKLEITEDKKEAGGGFGNSDTNQVVEKTAISFVKNKYKKNGWSVISVESENRGYDLICFKGKKQEHVEVKGIQGNTLSFIFTANEFRQSLSDENFVVCAVTSALTKPQLHKFTAKEFSNQFKVKPISYRAEFK